MRTTDLTTRPPPRITGSPIGSGQHRPAEQHGDDRVHVGVRRGQRQRHEGEQPREGHEADHGACDDEIGQGEPALR